MEPSERLEQFLDSKNISYDSFAKKVGASIGSRSKYVGKKENGKKKSTFSFDIYRNFSVVGLNSHWYLTGEGDPLISPDSEVEVEFITNIYNKFTPQEILENLFEKKQLSQKWTDEMAHEFIIKLKTVLPYLIPKAKMYVEINSLGDMDSHLNDLQKILK